MKVIIIVLALLLINIGHGCRTQHYLIADIGFNLAEIKEDRYKDKQKRVYRCESIVKDKLIFVISYYTEFIVQNTYPGIGNTCYALTLPRKIDNPLQEETFSLTFDQPFEYKGDIIEEKTNIFKIEDIRKEIDIYENHMSFCSMGADKIFEFSQSFFENATFQKKEHRVYLHCKTSDNKILNKEITIVFE